MQVASFFRDNLALSTAGGLIGALIRGGLLEAWKDPSNHPRDPLNYRRVPGRCDIEERMLEYAGPFSGSRVGLIEGMDVQSR